MAREFSACRAWRVLFVTSIAASVAIVQAPKPVSTADRPTKSAPLVRQDKLPLHTLGRYIVDSDHMRVKWACINWAGAYSKTAVVGGLEVQPLRNLSRRISEFGFNCVRLPYSTEGYIENPRIAYENIAANPEFRGMRFLDVFDKVVEALTDEGLMVIVNNHISESGWCCNVNQDEGYWYVPKYNESQWIRSLQELAHRYRDNPLVVAFDVRNEPHDNPQGVVTWGDKNNKTDWAAAAERAGNQVLIANPHVLIVVSAICFCTDLRGLFHHQVELMYPNRVVYEVHNYFEFQAAGLLTSLLSVSWVRLEHLFIGIALALLVLLLIFRRAWFWLGEPLPPHGVVRISVGFWMAVANLIAAPLYVVAFQIASCSSYGWSYFMPLCRLHLWLALLFGMLGVWGYLVYLHQTPTKDEDTILSACLVDLDEACGFAPFDGAPAAHPYDETNGTTDGNFERAPAVDMFGPSGPRHRAPRMSSGWDSTQIAWRGVFQEDRVHPVQVSHRWDKGLCCGLQCVCVCIILFALFCVFAVTSALADSYSYLQWVYDWKWGFALMEGYPYTAPIWMGEFGQATRGRYWKHLLSYLSVRDVDWAYWSFDGLKLSEGTFDSVGAWKPYPEARWEEEAYGLLNADYKTVRHPWKLLDLQAIMSSPSGWTADDYPCDRAVLGNACGG